MAEPSEKKRICFFLLLLAILFFPIPLSISCKAAAEPKPEVMTVTRQRMGTFVTIMVWHRGDKDDCSRAIEKAFKRIQRINDLFSTYRDDSEISKLNRNAGINPVKVPEEVFRLLLKGAELTKITNGAFDPSFAGAGELWDFKADNPIPPDEGKIKAALKNVGMNNLVFDDEARTVYLKSKNARIDPGGYIKGYAVDRAAAVLLDAGYSDFIVNAGGDMFVAGTKGLKEWKVGVQNPRGGRDNLIAVIKVKDRAVVTSGDYERFFIKDKIRYHHIIDPRSGRPARGCRSVTIVSEKTMTADAFATGVFVMGPEKGIEFLNNTSGVEGFIIDANSVWHFTDGFKTEADFTDLRRKVESNDDGSGHE